MIKINNIPEYKIEQFFAIRLISGFSLSKDGKIIAYITNTNGLPNIWTVPTDGGWTSQLTVEQNAVKTLRYSPDKQNIFYQTDINGDENLQIHRISNTGSDSSFLTQNHEGSQTYFTDFNESGSRFLFASNKRDKRFFDTYKYDVKTNKESKVYESSNIHVEIPSSWSKDENQIVFEVFYHNLNSDLILFNLKTKQKINFTAHEEFMRNFHATFSKDNKKIYFLSDYKSEFIGLAVYDIKKGKNSWLVQENWDISDYKLSDSGKYILFNVNEDGSSALRLYNIKTAKITTAKLPHGNVIDFSFTPDEKRIVLLFDQPDNPADIYVYDIAKASLKQITYSMIGGIPREHLVKPKKIRYKSFDGTQISALMYLPLGIKNFKKTPVILWPHGGPEFQERDMYRQYFQIMCNRGFIVVVPNFRGSTGYGKSFQRKIYHDWGGAEFRDYIEGLNHVIKQSYGDKNKKGIVGGSYGGYSVLTSITKLPDIWKCAVDIFGPSNLLTFVESIPEHWKPSVYELVGDPVKDKNYYIDRSPINYVDKIKCPLLIVQGANDIRVVKNESDQIVDKLKKQGKHVEYIVLEDEGHGFSKVSNQILVWKKIDEFLKKYLNNGQ